MRPRPRDERAKDLYHYAVAHPEGFTARQAQDDHDWSQGMFEEAVQALRDLLGMRCGDAGDSTQCEDTINLICRPNGRGPHLYHLVGTYDGEQPWTAPRFRYGERYFQTMESVTSSIVRGTDGRTTDGKKARLLNSTARFVKEQLNILGS